MERLVDALNPDAFFKDSLSLCGDLALAESQWRGLRPLLSTAAAGSDSLRFLFALLGNSPVLVQRLMQDENPTAAIDALVGSPHLAKPKTAAEMTEDVAESVRRRFRDAVSAKKILRDFKYREVTRIAARDLSGLIAFEEIGRELAAVAQAASEAGLRMAIDLVNREENAVFDDPFVVLGMGKFGGEDLNFSSDIDLLYVHGRSANAGDASRALFEHFCRVSETFTALIHERTEDGFVFRVDLDLRPEGKSGVIVNSSEAFASYYEISGAAWERAALTKARPVAGDLNLGREALEQVSPFVFPRLIDSRAVNDLKAMKAKINAELAKSRYAGFHVKLGVGGIREIEFFVTAFQLIYGGKVPDLRERHTMTALRLLKHKGLVPSEDAARLEDAYFFLRRIENRLQMEEERQTHRLPTTAAELDALARRMGFPERGAFEEALLAKTEFVADCFERLAS